MAFTALSNGETEVRSFKRQPDNRRSVYLQLVGSIESQLRQAFAKRHEENGLTQAGLAEKIGVDRSAVHRRLSGRANMTAETIADMVWALGHCIRVEIFDPDAVASNRFMIIPRVEEALPPPSKQTPTAPTSVEKKFESWELVT